MSSKIFDMIKKEEQENQNVIELVASKNYPSFELSKIMGCLLDNDHNEEYPQIKINNSFNSKLEVIAMDNARKLFGAKYVNVESYSCSSANMAVYKSLLKQGDKVLSMDISSGGYLTHGYNDNFSGKDYNFIHYNVEKETGQINYNELARIALKERPKLIIAGSSSYSRKIDFIEFKEIAKLCGAYFMVDMSNIVGLVAAGLYQNPLKYADIVTTTTDKGLNGPMGGLILSNRIDLMRKINEFVYPRLQEGPFINVIAGKAQCMQEAMSLNFINYQKQVIKNAKVLCDVLKMEGFKIVSNGTDNHMMLIDVKKSVNMTGKEAEKILKSIGIICNKNMIPFDSTTPFITSGIKIGTFAMTSRDFKEKEFLELGKIISFCLKNSEDEKMLNELKMKVFNLCNEHPISKEEIYE